VDPDHHPLLPTKDRALFVGVDAGIKHDTSAIAAVYREGDWLELALHRIWTPSGAALDLEETIEAYLLALCAAYHVQQVVADPYQMHRSITTLQAQHVPIIEFPQTVANTVRMGQGLFELLKGVNLRLYASDDLRAQALNTVAVENPRGYRIAKGKASRKIDAIVALSMACVAALDVPKYEPARLW
jgi:phage terminase large subunit-like protein